MDSVSTFNFGRSNAAQGLAQGRASELRNLATQARQLMGTSQTASGHKLQPVQSLSGPMGSPVSGKEKNREIMEVAKQFESLLIHQMLKAMRQTVHKSDLLNSFSLEQYESMLDEEIANKMAEHKGIGLADTLYYQLNRLEESVNPTSVAEVPTMNPEVKSHE